MSPRTSAKSARAGEAKAVPAASITVKAAAIFVRIVIISFRFADYID
jgi:hypothetical protein